MILLIILSSLYKYLHELLVLIFDKRYLPVYCSQLAAMSGKKWRFLGCGGQGRAWHRHLLSSDVMTKNNPPIPLIQKPPKQILLINYIKSSFPPGERLGSGFVLSILTSGQLFIVNLPSKLNFKTFPATGSIAASLVSQLFKTELHLPRHFSQVWFKNHNVIPKDHAIHTAKTRGYLSSRVFVFCCFTS